MANYDQSVRMTNYDQSVKMTNNDQSFGIPMGNKCALSLADLFLYSYETELFRNCYGITIKKKN
jgi:hypothetical protein